MIIDHPTGTNKKFTWVEIISRARGYFMSRIMNLTPHTINIIDGAEFDPSIRKYKGGWILVSIPSSGMVSAKQENLFAENYNLSFTEYITVNGKVVGIVDAPKWESVDPLPEGADYYIVSNIYVSACKELGIPTDNLLTPGNMVVEEDGRTVRGATCLIRN